MLEKLQINIEYDVFEDRLRMRISEKEEHGSYLEYRFWLTRRFISIFMHATDKIIADGLAEDVQISPDALEAMKKFQEDAALAKADFSSSYGPDSENSTIIGEKPLLVSKLTVKKQKIKNKYVFSFLTNENAGINIAADVDLIHTLRKMFFDASSNAGWNQPLFKAKGATGRKQ
jgi:hypothetical protein